MHQETDSKLESLNIKTERLKPGESSVKLKPFQWLVRKVKKKTFHLSRFFLYTSQAIMATTISTILMGIK